LVIWVVNANGSTLRLKYEGNGGVGKMTIQHVEEVPAVIDTDIAESWSRKPSKTSPPGLRPSGRSNLA
jgi:hypothetical protein